MPISPPNFSSDLLDKRVSEYLRRLAENQESLESSFSSLVNDFKSLTSRTSLSLTSSASQTPLLTSSLPTPIVASAPLQTLGQFPQGQFTYIPVLTTLPIIGDPLYKNGQMVSIENPVGTYTLYILKAITEPGVWIVVPTPIPPISTILPCCRVYNNANISLTNNTVTTITYNSERYDTDSIHDLAVNTNRLTCKTAGKYIATLNISFPANATGVRGGGIRFNGTDIGAIIMLSAGGADRTVISVATEYEMAVNDYLDSWAFQSSGGALNLESQGNYSPEFSMALVST